MAVELRADGRNAASMAEQTRAIDLSIVIVSWNTRALLDDCLESVYAGLEAAGPSAAEVWVVDNASDDNSAAMVSGKYPAARLIQNGENVGFARANNQALRQAAGQYLLLLNSDTIVPKGALAALVEVMEAHPDVAACSPFLLNGDGTPQFCWARFPGLKDELTGGFDLSQSPYPAAEFADAGRRAAMQPFPVDWVGGACFLVRAEAARQVGLLDEAFFMYCEETEWCHRFRRAGWQILLAPGVTVTHLGGQSSKAVPVETRRRMFRSRARLYSLMHDPLRAGVFTAAAFARYAVFRVRRALSPAGRGRRSAT